MEKVPPEKTIETLFLRYLLQCFPLGKASLYAPSTREEFLNGYDAQVLGPSAFWEVFLQFKRPTLTQAGFTIQLTKHQHQRLRKYPPKTAYYIAATFLTVEELMHAQRTITNPHDFLSRFIAIDLACLEDDSCFIKYEREDNPTEGLPTNAAFKRTSDDLWVPDEIYPLRLTRTQQARHRLKAPCFIDAATLLDDLNSRRVGSAILLRRSKQPKRRVRLAPPVEQVERAQRIWLSTPELWENIENLWDDEEVITENMAHTLADLPQATEEGRVLVINREQAIQRFVSGENDQFSGGCCLRLPMAPWDN
ncbi:MAG: hypothetical protein QM758_00410 [Armatimonas sp.]